MIQMSSEMKLVESV